MHGGHQANASSSHTTTTTTGCSLHHRIPCTNTFSFALFSWNARNSRQAHHSGRSCHVQGIVDCRSQPQLPRPSAKVTGSLVRALFLLSLSWLITATSFGYCFGLMPAPLSSVVHIAKSVPKPRQSITPSRQHQLQWAAKCSMLSRESSK